MEERTPLLGLELLSSGSINPTRSLVYILLLTMVVGGLQLSYSAEFANGSPYLLSLGMSKSLMSLVWIAGPISGTIGQPIVGILSDDTRLKYGRRRPYIIAGSVATIMSLLVMSWSKDIVALFSPGRTDEEIKSRTIPFAVVSVYVLDFSIQVIQAATRAFIVDNVPTHQQQIANAWAARMIGIGNIVAYFLGSMNLPQRFPWLGNTQFKGLSAWACIALVLTVIPACLKIHERDPNTDVTVKEVKSEENTISSMWRDTIESIKNLSPQTRLVCNVQFFAWIGYFPMLYYTSTYVGEIYVKQWLDNRADGLPPLTKHERELLNEEGVRHGTQALLAYSISSLIFNFLLPYITRENYTDGQTASRWSIPGLTVAKVWAWSHILFIVLALSTFWIKTVAAATVFVALLGPTWAICQWAPFTIVAQEVSRIKDKKTRADTATAAGRFMKYEHQAGVVLGVMNVFVSLPQIVASLLSSIIFKLVDSPDNAGQSIGWVFRLGAVAAVAAAYMTFRVKSPEELDAEDDLE